MSVEPNPIILSFYQASLLPIVKSVQIAWFKKDYIGAFNNLKLMFSWLPNVCKKEVKDDYEKALQTVEAIRNGYKEVDVVTRRAKIGIATRQYLYSEVIHLSEVFHDSLDKNRYLEKAGVKPRVNEVGKL